MKKIIFTALALLTTISINAQTIEVYEYDSNGNLSSTPAYTSTNKVKVIFKAKSTDAQTDDKVEGTTTINGNTYTKGVGGTVADYVDLGMFVDGKKVLWATHNLGASKPEEYGAYIAWGENGTREEGYVDGLKSAGYNWSTLKYCSGNTDEGPFTKYVVNSSYGSVDNKSVLESEDDAATLNWGEEWRSPTDAELTVLKEECIWTWYASGNIDYNGVAGYKVSGKNGNSIFLPAAGYHIDNSQYFAGNSGYYWSGSLCGSSSDNAYALSIYSSFVNFSNGNRRYGTSIRPVRTEASTTNQTDANLLSGKFSVAEGKQVQFTNGNLYWDGSEYKLEDTQIASSKGIEGASYNEKHISHFYWTNTTDYSTGSMPYSENWLYSSQLSTDKFWCSEDNPITVQGTDKLYTLTGGNNGEWDYLISGRKNASSLYKDGVSVDTATNCLIIAPDDYDYVNNPLKSSYTLDEINRLGIVCFPSAGCRHGSYLWFGEEGYYGLATPNSILRLSNSRGTYVAYEDPYFNPSYEDGRLGLSIRLVRTVE